MYETHAKSYFKCMQNTIHVHLKHCPSQVSSSVAFQECEDVGVWTQKLSFITHNAVGPVYGQGQGVGRAKECNQSGSSSGTVSQATGALSLLFSVEVGLQGSKCKVHRTEP